MTDTTLHRALPARPTAVWGGPLAALVLAAAVSLGLAWLGAGTALWAPVFLLAAVVGLEHFFSP